MALDVDTLKSSLFSSVKGKIEGKYAVRDANGGLVPAFSFGQAETKKVFEIGVETTKYTGLEVLLKELCAAVAEEVISHFKSNAEVKDVTTKLNTSLNMVFTAGVPAPMDGGAALQTAWKAATMGGAVDGASQDNSGSII